MDQESPYWEKVTSFYQPHPVPYPDEEEVRPRRRQDYVHECVYELEETHSVHETYCDDVKNHHDDSCCVCGHGDDDDDADVDDDGDGDVEEKKTDYETKFWTWSCVLKTWRTPC